MLSINTNLSSLIAQSSLTSSTNKLNQAIERMTTGFKINHAKDNAANYSISQNMQIQISSYDVAADNVAMGMDLVTTASDIISTMQNHASRLQALSTQARNGTYGAQSMAAINSEAAAIMAEINRLYSTAEYNNVSLFNREAYEIADHLPKAKAEYNGFIEDPKTYTDEQVAAMTKLSTVDVTQDLASGTYSISSVDELVKLAELANTDKLYDSYNNVAKGDYEFVLANDIDLSSISNWTPIGNSDQYCFAGTFDGNGHIIKNLKIDSTQDYVGLFGYAIGGEIKNIGVENCDVKGGSIAGGLVGRFFGTITNCYSTGNVSGSTNVGGLAGYSSSYSSISNSYATGNVSGSAKVGGLAGSSSSSSSISNSYATGNVNGQSFVAGLIGVGQYGDLTVEKSYSYGSANGTDLSSTGSLIGGLIANPHHTVPSAIYTLNTVDCQTLPDTISIGGVFLETASDVYTKQVDYDMSTMLAGISEIELKNVLTSLQVGINSDSSCQINFDTNFKFDLSAIEADISSDEALATIMEFTNLLSEKSTQLGAVQNRLDSAIESIEVNLNNLTSSLSTIRDADIAEVSSEYIRQQILQQASATLLATANQSPSIALQLI